jgi:hypothetical protein
MERIASMLTRVLIVTLLCAAAVTTGKSQEQAKISTIYGINNDGMLKWYRHDGAATGAGLETAAAWQGPNNVGGGWNDYESVFPGGANIIYGIKADGTLEWRQHQGVRAGSDQWGEAKAVGRGWGNFKQVFSGGEGIIYAITQEGKLLWYKHNAYLTGAGLETPGAWADTKEVGHSWGVFKQVFPGGNGVIYAITQDGKLLWYRHNAYRTGDGLATPGAWSGRKEVGHGWGIFKQVFSSGGGIIYAITQEGKLRWYRHRAFLTGAGLETPGSWEGPKEVGHSWGVFPQVFALLPGFSSYAAEPQPGTSDAVDSDSRGGPLEKKRDPAGTRAAFQPENTIKVSVRYRTELGYEGDTNAFGNVGPTSCSAFSVSVAVGDGSTRPENLIRISSDSKMDEAGGYYQCNYLVSEIPLNQPIRVSVSVSGINQFGAWKGGSQAQPPPGQQRTIIIVSGRDGGPLMLTATQPRARQLFEMVYTSQPR